MWTREMLKDRAKGVLRKSYWMIFLACLIHTVLGGANLPSLNMSSRNINLSSGNFWHFTLMSALAVFAGIAGLIFTVFVTNVVKVGLCRFLMEARRGKTDIGTLFWAFKGGRYWKIMQSMFIYSLYIFIGFILCVIPGVIYFYSYRYVPYILAENPNMDINRALQLSKAMTKGEKFDIFVFDLSFIVWYILGGILGGVGIFFVQPYVSAAEAELYAFVRDRSIANNLTNEYELPGFYTPPPYDEYGNPTQPQYYNPYGQPYQQNPYQQNPYGQNQNSQPYAQNPYPPPYREPQNIQEPFTAPEEKLPPEENQGSPAEDENS